MAQDPYAHDPQGLFRPYGKAEVVSKSDTVDLDFLARALWVGSAGDVSVVMQDGTTVVFTSVPAGSLLPIRFSRVNSTNTDASDMVALF
jgi:hypothetical protein